MKKLSTLLVLLMCMTSIYAQQSTVKIRGQLKDSITNETVPYATIKLLDKGANDRFVKGAVSDATGKFSLTATKGKTYSLSIEYTGRISVKLDLDMEDKSTLDLGVINFASNDKLLSEVVVEAQKVLVKIDLDKITYDVESDPESKTDNVLDMLKKVPLITVDGDDQIKLKGQSSYKIYMNGKPSSMIESNPKDVLKSMPANSVKNIEVITDPGARYDAEGLAGIINIITHKNTSLVGYTATVNSHITSSGGYSAGAHITAKIDKIGITANTGYSTHKGSYSFSKTQMERYNSTNERYMWKENEWEFTGKNKRVGAEVSYEIDTLNLVAVSYYLSDGSSKNNSTAVQYAEDVNNIATYQFAEEGRTKNTYGNQSINTDYQRTFSNNKDRLLTMSYRYYTSPRDAENSYSRILNSGTAPELIRFGDSRQLSDGETSEHTVQIDFFNPINKTHNVEVGVKYIKKDTESDNKYEMLENGTLKIPLVNANFQSSHQKMNNANNSL